MIEDLPLLTPDPRRSARTAARCHDRLTRRRQRLDSAARRADSTYATVERALVGALCVVYISGVAIIAIQVLSSR
jgi:hypothetical protein